MDRNSETKKNLIGTQLIRPFFLLKCRQIVKSSFKKNNNNLGLDFEIFILIENNVTIRPSRKDFFEVFD